MKCAIYTQAYDSPECFVENHKFSSVYSAFSIFHLSSSVILSYCKTL